MEKVGSNSLSVHGYGVIANHRETGFLDGISFYLLFLRLDDFVEIPFRHSRLLLDGINILSMVCFWRIFQNVINVVCSTVLDVFMNLLKLYFCHLIRETFFECNLGVFSHWDFIFEEDIAQND